MDSEKIIVYMIGICLIFIVFIFFADKFKTLGKIIFNGIIGSACIYIVNSLLSPLGLFVGINLLTFVITGLLGIPGLISLYLINAIL